MTRRLKTKLLAVAVASLANSPAVCQTAAAPSLSEPVKHHFTLVLKYFYWVQDYSPTLLISDLGGSGQNNGTPEAALGALAAAGVSGNYASWLSKWNPPSRNKIEVERRASKKSEAETLKGQPYLEKQANVVSFVSRSKYVMLRCVGDHKNYSSIAFTLTRDGWMATREVDSENEMIAAGNYDPPTNPIH
jgi:hypothetical protein